MESARSWMYSNRFLPRRTGYTQQWESGVEEFISFAVSHPETMSGFCIRCPCRKCKNLRFNQADEVRVHLYKWGFTPFYLNWTAHGEPFNESSDTAPGVGGFTEFDQGCSSTNPYERMVLDAVGPSYNQFPEDNVVEPNESAQNFFNLLNSASTPLWDGCESHSELSAAVRLLNLKSEYHMSRGCFNGVAQLMKETQPTDSKMPSNWYETKKLVSQLGLSHEKIDVCVNDCMLFWKDDSTNRICKYCGSERYKPKKGGRGKDRPRKTMHYLPLSPRLQRLFASLATAEQMRWHKEQTQVPGVLKHPSDGEAWKHFDQTYPWFASEPRNVRLGLCADGFTPFGPSGKQYSCWPVIVTPYNLPPWMCMKKPYMFLSLLIPGPRSPNHKIDVYLQPLIDELRHLWFDGVETWDVSLKQNFILRAALMWTINDFPAYGMLSGWMTHGRLSCPICMGESKAFQLKYGGKISFFDCHRQFLPRIHPYRRNCTCFKKGKSEKSLPPPRLSGEDIFERISWIPSVGNDGPQNRPCDYGKSHNWTKRSIFWELPYWATNLIRHNLDVMHIEKNVFENIWNTVMDVKNKTKDNVKARKDLEIYCNRQELNMVPLDDGRSFKPKARFTLDVNQRQDVIAWVKSLRLPDGYASNLGRCVDTAGCNMYGMKSHDCHVMMQRLLPIALEALPDNIWKPLTELSLFFRDLCSPELHENQLFALEENIPIIICKLERIFPPGFFDVMEHLPVHLPYEARVGGPVQYRWMYKFERCMHDLKMKVSNTAHVEGSICEAYLIEETSIFCSHYFESHVPTMMNRVPRNDDGGPVQCNGDLWTIFTFPGRPYGACRYRFLTDDELRLATTYVLLNCPQIRPYLNMFVDMVRETAPEITMSEMDVHIENNFSAWLRRYVDDPGNNIVDTILWDVACGPSRRVQTWPVYFTNGYKFHISEWGKDKSTFNSGVCIRSTGASEVECDFYGILEEVIQLEYPGFPHKNVVLFRCNWFDPTPERGTRMHKQFGLVEIRNSRRYQKFDPFILASQADQVYYTRYPSKSRERNGWSAVMKIKPRWIIQAAVMDTDDVYQDSGSVNCQRIEDDPIEELADPGVGDDIEEDVLEEGGSNGETEDEEEFISDDSDSEESEEFESNESSGNE